MTKPQLNRKPNDVSFEFELYDKIDLPSYTFYPLDTAITRNPIPYSFESEGELKRYIELAKNETFDTLFEKILAHLKDYVNIDEHILVILAADILYSYFQEKFGATHYNIFIGENGSGKNSALLVFKMLGYRVFYVTAASPVNYYTFLGEIQEGQGTISEDEVDDIEDNKDKQRILKTGYASEGSVPKVEFSKNGSRNQVSFHTFCHKWLAMGDLPDEKRIRGVLDRSFIFKCMVGDVKYNIKDTLQDETSEQRKQLIHLRNLLFIFKMIQQDTVFPSIKTNIKNRNAELTKPLLRIFYKSNSFEKIINALSKLINEKTYLKNNSIESKIVESLKKLIENKEDDKDKEIYEFTNDSFYNAFQEITDAKDDSLDYTNDTFYLPDGVKLSKSKISRILSSKFKTKPFRTNKKRGFQINKNDIEKTSKQYEVVDEIIVLEDEVEDEKDVEPEFSEQIVTQVTHSKDAIPSSCQNINPDDFNVNNCEDIQAKDKLDEIQDKDNINIDTPSSPAIINIQDKSNDKENDNILNNNQDSQDIQFK